MTKFCTRIGRYSFAAAAAWWLVSSAPSLASIDSWDTAASGVWQTGSNWLDNTAPAGGDEAVFDLTGAYTVTFNGTPPAIQALNLDNAANVTFTSIGTFAGQVSTLRVNSASGSQDVLIANGTNLTLGAPPSGSLVPRVLHLTVGDDLIVSTGAALNVRFGSDVITTDLSSVGHVNVSGTGSTLNVSSMANIRAGSLNVTAGGLVQSAIGSVSTIASFGDATVSGAGSQWIISTDLIVGNGGHGALDILNGGSVFSADSFLGQPMVNSSGGATVTGGNWTIAGQLSIGFFLSPGRLDIGPGGTVSVAQEVLIDANGALFLLGGTLDASTVSFVGTAGGFIGDFDWRSGTLHVGTFGSSLRNKGGVLAPGHSAGSTAIIGNYEQQSGATLQIEIGGPLAGSEFDFVNVTGNALLDGDLELTLINGFIPTPSQTFAILIAGSVVGTFDVITGDYLGQGLFLDPIFDTDSLTLVTTQAGPGDTDLDGDVDLSDLGNLATSFNQSNPNIDWINGDFDSDNDVDLNDLGKLATFFEGGRAQAYAEFQTLVPEPTFFAFIGLGMLIMTRRR